MGSVVVGVSSVTLPNATSVPDRKSRNIMHSTNSKLNQKLSYLSTITYHETIYMTNQHVFLVPFI
jgi:hypothetical protein